MITSLDLLATGLQMRPRTWIAFIAARAHDSSCSACCLPRPHVLFCRKRKDLYGQIQYKSYHLINTGGHSVGVNDPVLPKSITSRTLKVKCLMWVLLHYINYKLKDSCGGKAKPSNIKQRVGFELPIQAQFCSCLCPSSPCLRQGSCAKIRLWAYH